MPELKDYIQHRRNTPVKRDACSVLFGDVISGSASVGTTDVYCKVGVLVLYSTIQSVLRFKSTVPANVRITHVYNSRTLVYSRNTPVYNL